MTKHFLKIIHQSKLLKYIQPREEQQGFRKNRSTTDAIFIMRRIVEKSIDFNHPAPSGEIGRCYRLFERKRSPRNK
jgi:hypothetical protein